MEYRVVAAEQRVRSFLARRAGREDEMDVPHTERKPFGQGIVFAQIRHEDDALLLEVGYHHTLGADLAYQCFLEKTLEERIAILDGLTHGAKERPAIYAVMQDLLDRLAAGGKLSNPDLCLRYALFRQISAPRGKRGPNHSQRDALILNIMCILTSSEFGLDAKRGETSVSEKNACSVIERVFRAEFPSLNLSYDAVRGVWDRRHGRNV